MNNVLGDEALINYSGRRERTAPGSISLSPTRRSGDCMTL